MRIELDSPITLSSGRGYAVGTSLPEGITTSLAEIAAVAMIVQPRKNAQWLSPGIPIELGAKRTETTMSDASVFVFDFDEVDPERWAVLVAAVRDLWGLAGVAASTWSHGKAPEPGKAGRVRARLLLALRRPATAPEYAATWHRWAPLFTEFGCRPDMTSALTKINGIFYLGRRHDSEVGAWPFDEDNHPLEAAAMVSVCGATAWAGDACPVVLAPWTPPDPSLLVGPLVTGGGVEGRARAYAAALPRSTNTNDLYKRLVALADFCRDAGEFADVAREYIGRTQPEHSTGAPYSHREAEKVISDAVKHRKNAWGSRLL